VHYLYSQYIVVNLTSTTLCSTEPFVTALYLYFQLHTSTSEVMTIWRFIHQIIYLLFIIIIIIIIIIITIIVVVGKYHIVIRLISIRPELIPNWLAIQFTVRVSDWLRRTRPAVPYINRCRQAAS